MSTFETAQGPAPDGDWGTVNGVPITDELIDQLVDDAEAGFPNATARPVGRPRTVGHKPAETVTVRLDPERVAALRQRAERDNTTASAIMREALDHFMAS